MYKCGDHLWRIKNHTFTLFVNLTYAFYIDIVVFVLFNEPVELYSRLIKVKDGISCKILHWRITFLLKYVVRQHYLPLT